MFLARRFVALFAFVWSFNALAADAIVDAKSAAILQNLSLQLTAAKTAEVNLHLTAKTTNAPIADGNLAADYALAIERPNKMALVLKDGNLGATVVCDGTNTTTFIPKPGVYTVSKAPA